MGPRKEPDSASTESPGSQSGTRLSLRMSFLLLGQRWFWEGLKPR